MELTRSDWVAAFGLALALGAFALGPNLAVEFADWIRAAAGAVGMGVVAWRVALSDEVARLLALKAAGLSFFVCLVAAWVMPLLGVMSSESLTSCAWALMMAVWLVCWTVLRVRQ
jgi:hypothetical protein